MKKELFRNFELERLIFEEGAPSTPKTSEPAPDAVPDAPTEQPQAKANPDPEKTKEKAHAAIDQSAVQVEAYVGKRPDKSSQSAEGAQAEKTDIIAGARARYIPSTEGPVNIAYTVGGETRVGTQAAAGPGGTVDISGDNRTVDAPSGSASRIEDSVEVKATAGVEGVLSTGPVDLFLGVGVAGGFAVVDAVGATAEGTPVLETSVGPVFEMTGQAGARVNVGPMFAGASIGVNQSVTGGGTNVEGRGALGVTF